MTSSGMPLLKMEAEARDLADLILEALEIYLILFLAEGLEVPEA